MRRPRSEPKAGTAMISALPPVVHKSLREQVYDHLREALDAGRLRPGDPLNIGMLSGQLGVSRTPLREALLQLEWEGFVRIKPRSGIEVRPLTLAMIRDLYQIIGALESAVVHEIFPLLDAGRRTAMRDASARMASALARDDFAAYYRNNLAWHDVLLDLSTNAEVPRLIANHRRRLYDFPRRSEFVKDWELNSIREHERFLVLVEAGQRRAASDFMRDVHWSFEVQEPHIRRYYPEAADG